jgi:methionyl-tRNA formyltransferase
VALRVAFFGLPLAALLLSRDGHSVVYAGLCRKGAIGTRRLVRRLGSAVVVQPDAGSDATYERVRRATPDLVVSWFWTKKLPPRLLQVAPHGAIGVHPSLLPRHRGPDPYFWAIDSGDEETGVTAHRLDEEYDTGAILGQRRLRIDPSWSAWRLAKKLDRPSLALLRDVVLAYAKGTPPTPTPQDEARATDAPAPDEDLLAIRWSDPAGRIARRVRAASPWPGVFTEIGDALVTVTRAEVTDDVPRALLPGEAAVRGGAVVVRAGDGLGVRLLAGRIDDEDDASEEELAKRLEASRSG